MEFKINNMGMFVMEYKNVSIYAKEGTYRYMFGWIEQRADTLRQAKYRITKWINADA